MSIFTIFSDFLQMILRKWNALKISISSKIQTKKTFYFRSFQSTFRARYARAFAGVQPLSYLPCFSKSIYWY